MSRTAAGFNESGIFVPYPILATTLFFKRKTEFNNIILLVIITLLIHLYNLCISIPFGICGTCSQLHSIG